jgi:hypothetical protein
MSALSSQRVLSAPLRAAPPRRRAAAARAAPVAAARDDATSTPAGRRRVSPVRLPPVVASPGAGVAAPRRMGLKSAGGPLTLTHDADAQR